jgi:Domain of unknown function (DUF222)
MGYEAQANEPMVGIWRELDTLVDEVQHARSAVAEAQAHEAELLARAVGLVQLRAAERRAQGVVFGNDLPLREVSAELGAAMRVSDRTVQRRMDDAHTLVSRFSATFDAWRTGRIDRQHAMTIVDEGVVLTDDGMRAKYESLVIAVAEIESAGRMREIARVIAARIDPATCAERCKAALRRRDVRVLDLDDGMARLLADLPAPLAHAILERLNEFVRLVEDAEMHGQERQQDADQEQNGAGSACDAEARRTRGEIRADIFTDLLLTSIPTGHHDANGDELAGIRGEIHVTIPITTAAGIDDQPTHLTGYGPVDRDIVCRLMAVAPSWHRVLADLRTGAPVSVDRYRPSAELRCFLHLRDERCRFPGCTMKAWRCDADHTIDAALGGETCVCNLAHLCRRHHVLKHASPWQVEQIGGGHLRWTSPTGRVYADSVPATLRFVPHDAEAFDGSDVRSSLGDDPAPISRGDPTPF